MLYQKLLLGNNPYFISMGIVTPFAKHRHPEIELCYCTEGSYDIICENKIYSLSSGDLAVVGPMVSHEFPCPPISCQHIVMELGYTLLGECFHAFIKQNIVCHIFKKCDLQGSKQYEQLVTLIEEIAALQHTNSAFCELSIKGNLYKISALLLQMIYEPQGISEHNKKLTDIKKIDAALEFIHSHYTQPLTIESMSEFCGYSKSNFCKIFKNITGNTFHHALNRHRIDVACILLKQTDYTIEEIAQETGFADTKSFCRVFKNLMDMNAGQYRKFSKAE